MIVTVGASVISTIIVIRISTSCRPVPNWIRWLVLQKLPRLVCLNVTDTSNYRFVAYKEVQKKSFNEQLVEEEHNRHVWKSVSVVVDRYLMLIFSISTAVITGAVLIVIVVGSDREFENEMNILNNSWKRYIERHL